ncbi:asparaginase [Actinomyces sp. MRS3W]|uniref:asparaginase n=1 Tax=Actinomyces sp. MRS3W TaxID=2800796 RepID=UPI0028FD4507|nr:asparaginase [Actinomyces sp. MRS3W]MDU0347947.1 asparaginase [Actinomyces sp. MRS3W]
MHIHVTYAGGTIGMVHSPRGLRPGADLAGWLADLLTRHPTSDDAVPPASPSASLTTSLTTLQPLIDSADAAPHTWQAIVDDVHAHASRADAFVVLHGTDTLAYTAAALSYALTELDQPVVITGSQLPLGARSSDAPGNVTGALQAIVQGAPPGVHVFFADRLLAGNRATKVSSWSFQGFDSPNAAPLAIAGAPWHWSPASRTSGQGQGWPTPQPLTSHDIVVVDLVPGLTPARLDALLTPRPVAAILRAFGVGNVPGGEAGLATVVADAVAAGVAVVIASQCAQGEVRLGQYAAGDAVARAGAVGSADMTLEATYAKLQFLASQGLRGAELGAWMGRNLAGELTPSSRAPSPLVSDAGRQAD